MVDCLREATGFVVKKQLFIRRRGMAGWSFDAVHGYW